MKVPCSRSFLADTRYKWYLFYSEQFEFVPQAVAQIPWGHNRLIISRIKDIDKAIFYVNSAVDTLVKRKEDNPTIGILLCKKKDRVEAEFALRDINKPIGISKYLLTKAIPDEIQTKLPTVEQLENELSELEDKDKKERR